MLNGLGQTQAADQNIEAQDLHDFLEVGEQHFETDAFQCPSCKQRKKCRYRQAQAPSADEQMTTFVTCVICGNRWKFT
ncbi:hypothetical protein FPV67DRAFT_967347 [Lyophyllum atratum]|nr:hypothetical protein FPV67DRAFT_967347 [Lyophyllum atratum]